MVEAKQVSALTYTDDDREIPPHKVTGTLTTRYVGTLDYVQHLVDGEHVDPTTIEEPTDNSFCPTGSGGGVDPSCSSNSPTTMPPLSKPIHSSPEDISHVLSILQRVTGEDNLATIASARNKSTLTKERFDNALLKAYQDGKVSLVPNEGWSKISKEVKAAGFTNSGDPSAPYTHVRMRN